MFVKTDEIKNERIIECSQWLQTLTVFILIVASLLFIAVFQLPYGYYQFLKISVTFGSFVCLVFVYRQGWLPWSIPFALIILLFNPVIPIHLNRTYWKSLDILTGGIFIALVTFAWIFQSIRKR